ncbi:MAG: hypothetical protein F6J98_31030 [Moorea sp. SIO4G2]|nr:hypothetical protein [Moorena sp. SIO4G2]
MVRYISCFAPYKSDRAPAHATLRKRFGKADATRTQSVAIRVAWPFGQGLSFRAYAIAPK